MFVTVGSGLVFFLGVVLLVIGTWMCYQDWNKLTTAMPSTTLTQADASTLEGLAKVIEALKGHTPGMQMMLVGTLLLLIAIALATAKSVLG